MEKWGCWIAYHDPHSHQVYWYNHETTAGQWQTPTEVIELRSAANKNADGFDKVILNSTDLHIIVDLSTIDESNLFIDIEVKNVYALEESWRVDTIQNQCREDILLQSR